MEPELLRIVRTYGNHPSFCLMTLGNEYSGQDDTLDYWVDMLSKEDPRHLLLLGLGRAGDGQPAIYRERAFAASTARGPTAISASDLASRTGR